jgi:hypothetical protein
MGQRWVMEAEGEGERVVAGGKTEVGTTVCGSAIFSACGQYRYLLTRRLSEEALGTQDAGELAKVATFIMLNPSTADATRNDPTIRKCVGFARRWQCSTLQVINLFAVRATFPHDMKRAADPVGTDNWHWFAHAITLESMTTHLVICAWGVHGTFLGQDRAVLHWLNQQDVVPLALGFTRDGHPRHPLYVPYSAGLMSYRV